MDKLNVAGMSVRSTIDAVEIVDTLKDISSQNKNISSQNKQITNQQECLVKYLEDQPEILADRLAILVKERAQTLNNKCNFTKAVILTAILVGSITYFLGLSTPLNSLKDVIYSDLQHDRAVFQEATNNAKKSESEYKAKLKQLESEKSNKIKKAVDQEISKQKKTTNSLERKLNVFNSLAKASFDEQSQLLTVQLKEGAFVIDEPCDDQIHRCLFIGR